jgi:hypothetical protein
MERRGGQRFELHLPVALDFEGHTVPGFTQDVSGRGMFFYAEAALLEGAEVELTFTMPSEITLGESMPVRSRARVLRSMPTQGGRRNGIAVQLEAYEYLAANEPRPVAQYLRAVAAGAGSAVRPAHR